MRRNFLVAILAASAAPIALHAPAAYAQAGQQNYDIASQRLGDALRQYSEISGLDVIAASNIVEGKRSSRIQGKLAPDVALKRLLAGTGLIAANIDGTLVVRPEKNDASLAAGPAARSNDTIDDAQIVVTGSRIRGAGPTGSPVVMIERKEFEKSGFGTVQQMLQSLPQAREVPAQVGHLDRQRLTVDRTDPFDPMHGRADLDLQRGGHRPVGRLPTHRDHPAGRLQTLCP